MLILNWEELTSSRCRAEEADAGAALSGISPRPNSRTEFCRQEEWKSRGESEKEQKKMSKYLVFFVPTSIKSSPTIILRCTSIHDFDDCFLMTKNNECEI